jgi:hypothetical protein
MNYFGIPIYNTGVVTGTDSPGTFGIVNEKANPTDIALAEEELNEKGTNSIGTSKSINGVGPFIKLEEVSPTAIKNAGIVSGNNLM